MGEFVMPGHDGGRAALRPGTRVEVRSRFDGSWARGFEIVEAGGHGYRLRRLSDHALLPVEFGPDAVRPETLPNSLLRV